MFDRALFRLAGYQRFGLGLTIALAFVGGLLIIAQAWLLSTVVAGVFLHGQTLSQVSNLLTLAAIVIFARALCQMGSEITASGVAIRIKSELRRFVFDHLLALGPAYAHGERTGELTATVVEGIEALDAYFSQYIPQLVIAALIPLSILLVVLPIDLLSAIILLLTAPLVPVFMLLIGNAAEGLTRRQYNLLSRLSAHFLDTLQGLTTLKALNQSQAQAKTIGQVSARYATATLNVLRVAFLSALVLEIVAAISTAIVAVEIGLRLLYGQMEFQPALLILILAPEFYLPLRSLGLRFHAAASGASAARRIFEIVNTPVPHQPPTTTLQEQTAICSLQAVIRFSSVRYSYPSRAVLNGVSFEIVKGQRVALFGPSGAGKSTIINLLLRFAEATEGEILVDGVPLHTIPVDAWRAQIAWVPQSPHLLHDTIAANIRMGRPDATSEEVQSAARAAHLDALIESLPEKYETIVGENAARLSGGQAQRLALARALLRDAPILILDEPTSNVDPETEALLQASTEQLMAGRTVLVIAHRLATIYRADQIIVLSQGRVVQVGTHTELIEREGLYRQLTIRNLKSDI
ncbi:MAG: thiol reductant ABC exporter subunit CydD [Anaerolineae bacterium]